MENQGPNPIRWAEKGRLPKESCCDAWYEANQKSSDNEGYGALVYDGEEPWMKPEDKGRAHIGSYLPPVSFCPFCGAKKIL